MGPSCRIEAGFCFLIAVCLLLIPLEWFGAAMLAAGFHELCHYCAARILGIPILGISLDWLGAKMELPPMLPGEEVLVASAGPAGSMFLIFFSSLYPQLALCGLVQGAFNLLPIRPLDGGRILAGLFPGREGLYWACEIATAALLLGAGLYLWKWIDMGIGGFCLAGIVAGKPFLRKIPCIAGKEGVQ